MPEDSTGVPFIIAAQLAPLMEGRTVRFRRVQEPSCIISRINGHGP